MALGKGIPVINGFDLNSKLPLDSRTVADTKENMNKLVTDESVGDGQLCYCKADKKLYVLKDNAWSEVGGEGSGGGKSVPPTLNLADLSGNRPSIRTTITEEEKTNLENGLYNQVLFPGSIPDEFQVFMPSKLVGDKSLDVNMFVQFDCVMSDDTAAINALSFYKYSFGAKDTSGNYPITITKQFDMSIGGSGGGSGGGDIWYEISSISNSTITQDQYNELTNLINADKLAGIRVNNEGYFTLFAVIDGNYIFVGYNMSIGLHYAHISPDLSTKESYTQLVMFNEKPTSQVIPSFSPIHNAQENLTIGDGLAIENGALKATGGGGGPLLDMFQYYDEGTQTVSQEGFDLLEQKITNNEIVGISRSEIGMCLLLSDIKDEGLSFIGPYQSGYGKFKVTVNYDLSVIAEFVDIEGPSTNLTLPQTAPTSQLIPSITTSNEQQNLTIGNGLVIENGALQTKEKIKIFQINISRISTTHSDTSKLITISITPSGMNAYNYINTLVDNNKLFNLSLYLKSAVIDNNCLTFNIPLTFVSSGTDRTRQGFSSSICVAPNILGSLTLTFESANNIINIIFYIPDDTYYEGYKQVLALFTTDTILKLEIKTDE